MPTADTATARDTRHAAGAAASADARPAVRHDALTSPPPAQGLYDPAFEHDSCGVGFVADMSGVPSRAVVDQALQCLVNLDHRSATGAEANVGDGIGITVGVPDRFLRAVCDFELPSAGSYAVGTAFLPRADPEGAAAAIAEIMVAEGLEVLGWRDVPTDPSSLGKFATDPMPVFRMLFVAAPPHEGCEGLELERRVYVARKRTEHEIEPAPYFPRCRAAPSSTRGC